MTVEQNRSSAALASKDTHDIGSVSVTQVSGIPRRVRTKSIFIGFPNVYLHSQIFQLFGAIGGQIRLASGFTGNPYHLPQQIQRVLAVKYRAQTALPFFTALAQAMIEAVCPNPQIPR